MTKNFLLFAGHDYYPEGGANDLIGRYESFPLALKRLGELTQEDWAHVYCADPAGIVQSMRRSVYGVWEKK
jgi:hypothetical protein